MFVLYNASLRGFPEKDVALLEGNKYETTIFAIASGITKLSKVSGIPPKRQLWRGLGGMILPDQFWRNVSECVVALTVKPADGRAQHALEALRHHVKDSDEGLLESALKTRVLHLGPRGSVWEKARVVSEGRVEGGAVLLTLALGASKFDFLGEHRASLCEAVKACCGDGASEVTVAKVSDKPLDFKGGGEPILHPITEKSLTLGGVCQSNSGSCPPR